MNTLPELDALIQEDAEITGDHIKKLPDYLKRLRTQLSRDKYKFVFIGQKGIGKTTSILALFGLTKPGKDGKPTDLLSTASGGTTTCEVELRKSEQDYTYFKIEPISDALFDEYIDDFCTLYYDADDDADEKPENSLYVPSEIERSIRNMIGLKKSEIAELSKKCASPEKLKIEILRRINKEKRTETLVKCERQTDGFFASCREKFNEINLCKLPNVFLPKKIYIYLTKDVLDFDAYPILDSIVDTRGIDTVSSNMNNMKREDILHYIKKEQEQCLFFFVDGIKPAPSQDITEMLKLTVTIDNSFRFYIQINIYGNEAEEVMTDDGKAESSEIGIAHKRDDIVSKFKQINLWSFDKKNLLFYNARMNLPARQNLIKTISDNVNASRVSVYEMCGKIEEDFENSSYALKKFDALKKEVEDVTALEDIFDKILKHFFLVLKSTHHSTIKAVNRKNGEHYSFKFFDVIREQCIEKEFENCFSKSKDKIVFKINEFLDFKNITESDKHNYKDFLSDFENEYNKHRDSLKYALTERIKSAFSDETWKAAQAEQGKGYKDRVLAIYQKAFDAFAASTNVKNDFKNAFDTAWKSSLNCNNLSRR
ncbi:MAG: hypothetical protein LBG87_05970 [Spirochaetaceae bacterium]|nr:hypothetical protein [Spirochaetaceae bacterium]